MHTIPKVTSVLSPPTSTPGAAVITDTAGGCAGGRRWALGGMAWLGQGEALCADSSRRRRVKRIGGEVKMRFRNLCRIEEEENEYY